MNMPALEELRAFRHHVYPLFGCRRDALFELLDALLTALSIENRDAGTSASGAELPARLG